MEIIVHFVELFFILSSLPIIADSRFNYYESLSDSVFLNYDENFKDVVYEKYVYGKCIDSKLKFNTTHHFNYTNLASKDITYVLLDSSILSKDVYKYPTPECILLIASAYPGELISFASHEQNMCIVDIVYTHSEEAWEYQYVEWFVPMGLQDNVNWDMFIFHDKKQLKDRDEAIRISKIPKTTTTTTTTTTPRTIPTTTTTGTTSTPW